MLNQLNNPVIGTKLQVLSNDGKVVDEWITTDKEHIIHSLEIGKTYTLHEIKAPKIFY